MISHTWFHMLEMNQTPTYKEAYFLLRVHNGWVATGTTKLGERELLHMSVPLIHPTWLASVCNPTIIFGSQIWHHNRSFEMNLLQTYRRSTLDGWEVHSYTIISFLHIALAIPSCPWGTLQLSIKSLNEGQNCGFDPSRENFLLRTRYLVVFWSLFSNMSEVVETSSSHH